MSVSVWIIATWTISAISVVLLPYLWYLFWSLRHHFLIAARFPKITLFMSILAFISSTIGGFSSYVLSMHNYDKAKSTSASLTYPILIFISMILAFIFVSSIVYRAFLVYDKWITQQYALTNQSDIIIGSMDVSTVIKNEKTVMNSNRLFKRVVIIILSISFIITIITLPGMISDEPEYDTQRMLFPLGFTTVIILGIFILINARKISESMLCQRETYMIGAVVLINVVLDNLPLHPQVVMFIGYLFGMYMI